MTVTLEFDETEQTLMRRPAPVVAPVMPVAHFLSYIADGRTRRVRITPEGVTIGRHPACEIVFPVAEVSRQHCKISLTSDGVVLADLGSTNGTFMAGRRVDHPVSLRNGSHVTVGHFHLRYEQRDERELEAEERLSAELRQAVDYVRAILPAPIEAGPIRVGWWYAPSSELGGDAFGYDVAADGSLTGFLIDVSGHGIGAGMHAVNVANTLRRRGLPGVDFSDPGQVAAGLNAMFPMEQHGGMILTLWYFAYDQPTRTLRYTAAGHHPALLAMPGAAEPHPVGLRAPSIGMLPPRAWPSAAVTVPPDSRLYVFSDGVFEIEQADGTTWQIDHLRRIIASDMQPEAQEPQRVYQAVRAAARPGPLADDFSLLVLHFD